MKLKNGARNDKVSVISTHHSVRINNSEVDIFYLFEQSEILVFVDGKFAHSGLFHPSRIVINYVNLVEVAHHVYSHYVQRHSEGVSDSH